MVPSVVDSKSSEKSTVCAFAPNPNAKKHENRIFFIKSNVLLSFQKYNFLSNSTTF